MILLNSFHNKDKQNLLGTVARIKMKSYFLKLHFSNHWWKIKISKKGKR